MKIQYITHRCLNYHIYAHNKELDDGVLIGVRYIIIIKPLNINLCNIINELHTSEDVFAGPFDPGILCVCYNVL